MWAEPLANVSAARITLDSSANLNELTRELSQAGWFVATCECAPAHDKATLIHAIAESLRFPEWTGRNWDALADALTDLSWIDEPRLALIITGFGDTTSIAKGIWSTAHEIVDEALAWWRDHEKSLVVLMAPTET